MENFPPATGKKIAPDGCGGGICEFPDACCHVINRGNFQLAAFREDPDRQLILVEFANFVERVGA
ncbi:MAG: hypothetical protein HN742_32155 [Lentisphaerae bacterium]|jgi:hypothetical protein|nr:hypothetical protein [Lentisphaerota bacterium]MBT4815180.1 hypothetical protein [Lentisphaerota bacterium]MBT5607109.1 hypothetical protein [Lentisphaerota bacterium]MBT7059218.1 hypothetical protein [Lentisphaerota bacterium]MBT7846567.1 hypothetical protein [Lentisphaerota bacterium]